MSGFVIVIAWPETRVIKVNMWYDTVMKWTGHNKGEYYVAGHSACVLVDKKNKELHYFDFGRYHTPPKYGRVRDKFSDPELNLSVLPKFEGENLINADEIIEELTNKKATHGEGNTNYSVAKIDFEII